MSPPVRPEQTLPPQELARIQANVAKMRSMGAPESDVLAYLQHEDSLATALPHNTMNAVNPNVTPDNIARSLAQGVSMGFGDELAGALHGSAARDEYRRNANTFKSAHPIVDAALKALGAAGASAPLLAFGPELFGTAKGVALVSGLQGAAQGAGESDSPTLGGRLLGAGEGAATGVAGGLLGYGGAKVLGSAGTSIMDRINPERAVAKAAAPLLNAGKLAEVDAVAPGGASLATTAIPSAGRKLSRLNNFLRGIGANPEAGAAAENNFLAQGAALEKARLALGDQMDAMQGRIPLTPASRRAVATAKSVIAKHAPALQEEVAPTIVPAQTVTAPAVTTAQSPAPDIRSAVSNFWDRAAIAADRALRPSQLTTEQQSALAALERHGAEAEAGPRTGTPPGPRTLEIAPERVAAPGQPAGYDLQDMRDALSRLRAMERAARENPNTSGPQLHDITDAEQRLERVLYKQFPDFEALDTKYGTIRGAQRQTDKALKTVQDSRSNYAANSAYKQAAGSLGGSITKDHARIWSTVLDHIFLNKAGAADATARLLTTPGGPELIPSLLSAVPTTTGKRIPALVGGSTAASANALRGLLFSPDSTQ